MSHKPGIPFHGELVSSDLTTAAEATLYEAGSRTARSLAAYEYVEIDDITIVQAVAGELTVFVSDNATVNGGERALAGDFSANGGEQKALQQPYVGAPGETIRAVASAAGNVKLIVQGRIRQVASGNRPSWKEAQAPS